MNKTITPQEIEAIGFTLTNSYDHDRWHTKEFVKGCIKVFLTTPLAGIDTETTMDVEVKECTELFLDKQQLIQLDAILNKSKI